MRRSDLDDLVGARGEQGSRRGLVVHVNNAVLAVVEGCRGSSTATDKQNGGCFSDASMQTKLRMCNDLVHSWKPEGEWVLPTLRQWWTRGSCHTRAPRTRSPSGGWWNVWTNTCHTLPAHTSCSGAEGHNCTFTATKTSLIVLFFFWGGWGGGAENWEVPVSNRSSCCPTSAWNSRRKAAHTSGRSRCPAILASEKRHF